MPLIALIGLLRDVPGYAEALELVRDGPAATFGASQLSVVREDPDFDPARRVFYDE